MQSRYGERYKHNAQYESYFKRNDCGLRSLNQFDRQDQQQCKSAFTCYLPADLLQFGFDSVFLCNASPSSFAALSAHLSLAVLLS